jgi:hypothetical protein
VSVHFTSAAHIIICIISFLLFVELIVFRPYYETSEKLRAIYFSLVYMLIGIIGYMCNAGVFEVESYGLVAIAILGMLGVALLWTYFTLVRYLVRFYAEQTSDRKEVVVKVFEEVDSYDKKNNPVEEEEALIKKLMKKYERV